MLSQSSDSLPRAGKNRPSVGAPKVPRSDSLLHQLRNAKDATGQPISLLDELLLLLDDPPPDIRDRWQNGADWCGGHGIATSRMAVWRLYHVEILRWRRALYPPAPMPPPGAEDLVRLQDEARYLVAQRIIESLHDPELSPGHLIGLLQNENQRQQLQLARDIFNDRLATRSHLEQRQHYERIEQRVRDEQLFPAHMESLRKTLTTLLAIPPDTTS